MILPVISRGSRAHITAASMKINIPWSLFTVFELSEIMGISQDQSLQPFYSWLPDLMRPGLLTVVISSQQKIRVASGQEKKSHYHHLLLEPHCIFINTFRMQWQLQGNTSSRISSSYLPAILSGHILHTLFYPTISHITGLIANILCYLSYVVKV